MSLVQSSVTLIASPHRGYYLLLPTAHWPLSSVPRTRPTGNAGNPLYNKHTSVTSNHVYTTAKLYTTRVCRDLGRLLTPAWSSRANQNALLWPQQTVAASILQREVLDCFLIYFLIVWKQLYQKSKSTRKINTLYNCFIQFVMITNYFIRQLSDWVIKNWQQNKLSPLRSSK